MFGMSPDLQREWAWVVVEMLVHQREIDNELDELLQRWEAGECSPALAAAIEDLSDAATALDWGRGDHAY